jgi:sugar phosphate isomerase/epimerase
MFRFGASQWFIDQTGPAVMARAGGLGFQTIHLDFGRPGEPDHLGAREQGESYRSAARQNNLEIGAFGIRAVEHIGMLGGPSSQNAQKCRDIIHAGIDTAAEWGVRLIYIPSFFASEIKDDATLESTADVLREACTYSEGKGVEVATENTLGGAGNARLVAKVNHKKLRVLVDTYNPILWGQNVQQLIRAIRPHMCDQVHAKDGKDGVMGNAVLGEGDGQFDETAKVLVEENFQGTIIIENNYLKNAESRVPADFAALRRYFS